MSGSLKLELTPNRAQQPKLHTDSTKKSKSLKPKTNPKNLAPES